MQLPLNNPLSISLTAHGICQKHSSLQYALVCRQSLKSHQLWRVIGALACTKFFFDSRTASAAQWTARRCHTSRLCLALQNLSHRKAEIAVRCEITFLPREGLFWFRALPKKKNNSVLNRCRLDTKAKRERETHTQQVQTKWHIYVN